MSLFLVALLIADEPTASQLYTRGRQAEKKGHIAQAYLLYSQAAAKDPTNRLYWQRSQAVRSRAALEAKVTPQLLGSVGIESTKDDPDDDAVIEPEEATLQDIQEARKKLPPAELNVAPGNVDIDLRGDSKQLWTEVAKRFGLDCIFDGDYEPTKSIHFVLKEVDYRVALRGLSAATGTFLIPLTSRMFMVAKDTPQKRTELEPRASVSIPLPPATSQQAFTIMVTAVQQAVGLEKVVFDTAANTVILRDTLAKVMAAQALFRDLTRKPGEVVIDLKFVEVSRNDLLTYGLDLPNTFTLTPLTNWFNNSISVPQNIVGLLKFGGGKTMFGIGILTPSIQAQMTKGEGSNLLEAQLRSDNGKQATMHIGQQYPVVTSGYFGPSNFTNSGTVFTPPPSFEFVDLGLTLKVTPWVNSRENLTLDLDAEFKVLTSQSVDGIPVIANRVMKTTVGLKLGQWAAIGGLLDTTQAHNIAGIAGLTRIPYIGPLTNTYTKSKNTDELLIMMRPHLLSAPPGLEGPARSYWLGSETRPITPL